MTQRTHYGSLGSMIAPGRRTALALGLVVTLSLLAGCATPSSPATSSDAPTTTQTPSTQANSPSTFSDREPKRLESKVLIDMGELKFVDAQGTADTTFRVPVGKVVGLHVRNPDELEHEILVGRGVAEVDGELDGYNASLFDLVEADVFVYGPEKVEIGGVKGFGEIELESGSEAWIRVTFPESTKGSWEIGCFVPGHYDAGMKATLIIE